MHNFYPSSSVVMVNTSRIRWARRLAVSDYKFIQVPARKTCREETTRKT